MIKYSEIMLKSRPVRLLMANTLKRNIEKQLGKKVIDLKNGRLLIRDEKEICKDIDILKKIPGVSIISPVIITSSNINDIYEAVLTILGNREGSIAVRSSRISKKVMPNSQEVNEIIGEKLSKNWKINLSDPDIAIYIERDIDKAFIYTERIKGMNGLPIGVSGKAIVLISGGIDSPVSALMAMKRGIKVKLLHLKINEKELERVKDIHKKLREMDKEIELKIIDYKPIISEIAKKLIELGKEKYTCIICKRTMVRIATMIAEKDGINTIVLGNNIGQVASQTLEHLLLIHRATNKLIVEPLIALNKEEVIEISKSYGLFFKEGLNKCLFTPRKVATRSKEEIVKELEREIGINDLIEKI